MSAQLPLDLRWPAHQRFAGFVANDGGLALELVRAVAIDVEAPWVFLAGASGSGKTHLLIAACAAADEAGRSAQYVSIPSLGESRVEVIRAFGGCDVLALDDIDALAGDRAAEHALFDLYNRSRADGATLIFAASRPPAALALDLPDLASRLSICAQASVRQLDEADRRAVVRRYAAGRGILLDDPVLDWLFTHRARDLATLIALLDRIDRATLAAQRRVTIPFLRTLVE